MVFESFGNRAVIESQQGLMLLSRRGDVLIARNLSQPTQSLALGCRLPEVFAIFEAFMLFGDKCFHGLSIIYPFEGS
jgi:hypothetical protein